MASNDYNKIILIGRLTQTPELRFTPQGSPVTTLRVASGRKYKTKSGEEREETLFIDAEVWGPQAENCAQYLVKGQKVLVEGELNQRSYEAKSGEKRTVYEIRASRVIFMEKPRGAAGGSAAPPAGGDEPAPSGEDDGGTEIPF